MDIVEASEWPPAYSNIPAFTRDGKIYICETIPAEVADMLIPHESTHIMRQTGYQPYLDFVERTPEMLDMSNEAAQTLLEYVAKHQNSKVENADPTRLYDELNATLYGHIGSGNMRNLRPHLEAAFHDFHAYAKELEAIHEQFKQHNQKGTKFSFSDGKNKSWRDSKTHSLKEEQHGEERAETQADFKRRCNAEGYTVYENGEIFYGYRTVPRESAQETAGIFQEEVKRLGIDADIVDGAILWNRNGVTVVQAVPQAVTAEGGRIFISNDADMSAREMAGHEAFHFWKDRAQRDAYIEVLEDHLDFSSPDFLEYQSTIAEAYLGEDADLSNPKQVEALMEEVFAYISGHIHEGTHDADLRGMFRDFDAVKAAWEALAESDAGGRRSYSLKGSEAARETAKLREENELLRERVEYWKGQTRRTTQATTDKKAVEKAAKQLIKDYGADIAADEIQSDLQNLYDYMASGHDGKNELTWKSAHEKARQIAQKLVENAVAIGNEQYEEYSDLRKELRGTKLILGKEWQEDIQDFNEFRKRNFGRLNLSGKGKTNIDQVYHELSALWPEFFDEQAHSHPADQLLHIAEVMEGIYEITEYNPFSKHMEQAVTGAANEIMEMFFDLPQTRKTFADRRAAELDAAKAKGRQQVQRVRQQRDERLARLREENRERTDKIIARARRTRERQLDALKDRYAAKETERRARELRGKIVRHTSALSQKLLRPSDKQHIPEEMRTAVAAMLESINLESKYETEYGRDGQYHRVKAGSSRYGERMQRTEAFSVLKAQYARIVAEGGDMTIDPALFGSAEEGIAGKFDEVIAMGDTKLADMNMEQLTTVWQVVKAVEHSVNTAGKVLSQTKYVETEEWANALADDSNTRRAKRSLTRSHALIDLETPYTFFAHYGEAGKEIYRMLRNAQDKQQLMTERVAKEAKEIVDPKTVKALEERTQTFTTEKGEELTLSTAHIMELYELMQRAQAREHLCFGGVVQPEIRSAKIRRGTESIRLSEGDLAQMISTLTAEQKAIANRLQKLTTELLAEYGNEASMQAYGYRKFTEKDYWPIRSAKEVLHSNIEKGGSNTRAIKNIGMAKSTMPHARNALDLGGIFTTFSNHAADMVDYAAWLCPMEDANRLFNYQFQDAEGDSGKSVKGLLDKVGGTGAQKYWHNLMEDIQNGINATDDSPMWSIVGKTVGGFKGAAVSANARVVIQQPTAFFRAGAVLHPSDMARGLAGGATEGKGWEKATKYSPIAKRKDAGGFDISSPTKMKETLFDSRDCVRKVNDALSAPAGMADAVTWGKLWNACEWATVREHSDLAKGSEAFYQQVAKEFAEVIDQTQVVDGVLQRSNIMRSGNAVVQQATSFMGEPIMSLNLLLRSYDQFRYEQNAKKRGKAMKTLGRAAAALVVTNVVNALAQSVVDAMRDDDEDKKYWARFAAAFTGIEGDEETFQDYLIHILVNGNVGSNNNPLGQVPLLKDGLSLAQGYSVSRTDMEVVSDIVDAAKLFIKSADGKGQKTTAYSLKALAASTAKLFGIPVSNLTRDIWAAVRTAAVETDNIPLQYEMEKAIYNISNTGNKKRYYDIMYRALEQGDTDSYQHMRAELMEKMGLDGKSIDSAMQERYRKAAGNDPAYSLSQKARDLIGGRDSRAADTTTTAKQEKTFSAADLNSSAYQAYAAQRASDYRSMANSLEDNAIFRGMDAESREKVLEAAYSLAEKTALEENSGGAYEMTSGWTAQADDAEDAGIADWEYVLFHIAYNEMESTKDADGKTVRGESKSDHVRDWLEDYAGFTEEQRAFLWGTVYKSEW